MSHLVIVSGLPGSGKTTFAETAYPTYLHLETDKLMMKSGEYVFQPDMLKAYHSAVQTACLVSLKNKQNVVVSNTFSKRWEMQPYLDMPYDLLTVYKIESGLSVAELAQRSVHAVPEEVIAHMAARWEAKDGEYIVQRRVE